MTSSPEVNLVVCGSIGIDRFLNVARLPLEGETILGTEDQLKSGGKGGNTAVSCAKMGGKTYFMGAFGDDIHAKFLKDSLSKHKINSDYSYQSTKGDPSQTAYIFSLPNGNNAIIVAPGVNHKWPNKLTDKQVNIIKSCDVVLLQREIPENINVMVAKIAYDNNIPVILDVGGEDTVIPNELLQYVTIISPNETELIRSLNLDKSLVNSKDSKNVISPQIIKSIKNIQSKQKNKLHFLLKLGEYGSQCILDCTKDSNESKDNSSNDSIIHTPALKVNVVDTTGAGDTFTGAFAVEWIRQMKLKNVNYKNINKKDEIICFKNAMKFACVAGSLSVTKKGAANSIPTLNEVNEKLKMSNNSML